MNFKEKIVSIFKKLFIKSRKAVNNVNKETEVKVKYPLATVIPGVPLMARSGTYKNKFPEGAIIHFTAGWNNQKGIDAVKFANSMGHRYFFIDEKGEVFQQFCLTGYGPHAGASKCPVTGRDTVAQYYVGIEVACGGRLEDADRDGQVDDTYFKTNVPENRMRKGSINGKWQKSSGTFETFTEAQELALKKLCTWLCENGVKSDLLLGHDEVSPSRKNDPGLSLSMSMDDFRKTIKASI